MKTLSAVIIAALLGAAPLWAHEEGATHTDLIFGQPPEYLHVLLHSVLIVGLALALLMLVAGLIARSKPAQVIALALVLACSATAWPVLGLGQNAYNRIRPQSDEPGQAWAREHMRRAETFVYVFYATALLAAAGLLAHRKWPKAVKPIAITILVSGLASLGVGGWISKAGGQIRHPEFRDGKLPPQKKAAFGALPSLNQRMKLTDRLTASAAPRGQCTPSADSGLIRRAAVGRQIT